MGDTVKLGYLFIRKNLYPGSYIKSIVKKTREIEQIVGKDGENALEYIMLVHAVLEEILKGSGTWTNKAFIRIGTLISYLWKGILLRRQGKASP